jgi:hypothetical protein
MLRHMPREQLQVQHVRDALDMRSKKMGRAHEVRVIRETAIARRWGFAVRAAELFGWQRLASRARLHERHHRRLSRAAVPRAR